MKRSRLLLRSFIVVLFAGCVFLFSPLFFGTRSFTEIETEILMPLYGSSVDLQKVRIKNGGSLTWAYPGITVGNVVSFPKNAYNENDKKDQALLVHEVCHVWQYQNFGLGYIPRSLWELVSQSDPYVIHYDASKSLRDYDVEEQCEIMAEYFLSGEVNYQTYVDELNLYEKTP